MIQQQEVPEQEHDIEVWDIPNTALLVPKDPEESKLHIFLHNTKFSGLPFHLEAAIEKEWNAFQSKQPNAQDNMTTYHGTYDRTITAAEEATLHLHVAGFRYQQVINRTPNNKHLLPEANRHGIITCSTHSHIRSSDGFLLYGTKKNQFNQISGFGGFPQVGTAHYTPTPAEKGERTPPTKLDVHAAVLERLHPEIGIFAERVAALHYVGLVFVGRHSQGLRGTDLDFLIDIDATAQEIIDGFEETHQHLRRLLPVQAHHEALAAFVAQGAKEGKQFSPYALGCMYNISHALDGSAGANKFGDEVTATGGDLILTPHIHGSVAESMLQHRKY